MNINKEKLKGVIWDLAASGRINRSLLHFPDDVALSVQEYINRVIGDLADKAEETDEVLPLLDDAAKENK